MGRSISSYGMNISAGNCRISVFLDALTQKLRAASNCDEQIVFVKGMLSDVAGQKGE